MEVEVEEKVDADQTAVGTETWTDGPGRGTSETRQNQIFASDQSQDGASEPEAGPGDAGTACDGSYWDRSGEEGIGSVSECPTLESSVCQSNNTISVIVCIPESSETAGDAAAVCSAAEAGKEEVSGDNQSVSTATPSSQTSPTATEHPGKVIVTNVTINSLTVTFKEATVAEGFFKGY